MKKTYNKSEARPLENITKGWSMEDTLTMVGHVFDALIKEGIIKEPQKKKDPKKSKKDIPERSGNIIPFRPKEKK